jgi:transcriptional regulator
MYIPESFRVDDAKTVTAFMARYDFATLVTHSKDGSLLASHVPVLVRESEAGSVIVGHLARANPHWRFMNGNGNGNGNGESESLAIFHGPHGYISPTGYVTSPAVPTWNYAVVHAHGKPRARGDAEFIRGVVIELTERYESSREPRWDPAMVPAEFLDKLLGAIVGFEMPIVRLEAKFKLGQNRSAGDRNGSITSLEQDQAPAARELAEFMKVYGGGV